MTSKARFSLIEPTIQDLKVSLSRKDSKSKQDLENATMTKILFLGSSNVGKSSIISKFLYDFFPDAGISGLEEHYTKLIKYQKRLINLNLVDTGSLDDYSVLYPQKFSYGVSGYVFIYSVDDPHSFEFVQRLRSKLKELNGRHLPCVLVANKIELVGSRKVKPEEGRNLAKLWDVPYLEVSAKKHTSDLITKILEVLLKEIMKEERPRNPSKFVNRLSDEKILKQIGIFRFGNLLSMLIGIFYILFGGINIITQDFNHNGNGILLMVMIILGLLIMIHAILGFVSFKSEEPEQIRIYLVLSIISCIGQIATMIYKWSCTKSLFVQETNSESGTGNFLYADEVVAILFVSSALIEAYLSFLALNSKELLRRRREIKVRKLLVPEKD